MTLDVEVPMELYKVLKSGSSQFIAPNDPHRWLKIIADEVVAPSDKPHVLEAKWCNWSRRKKDPVSNWSPCSPFLLCDDSALVAIRALLPGVPTAISVRVPGSEELKAVMVPEVDAWAREMSEFTTIPGTSLIAKVDRHVFDVVRLNGLHVFRVPDFKQAIFATDQFAECAQQAGLKGLEFEPIRWAPLG